MNALRLSPVDLAKGNPWLAEQLARERDPAFYVTVPEKLSKPSPVLASTIAAVSIAVSPHGRKTPERSTSFQRGVLHRLPIGLRVTPDSADRALRILDTIIKACTARNILASVKEGGLNFEVGQYGAQVRISEAVNERVVPNPRALKSIWAARSDTVYEGTGKLAVFVIRMTDERKLNDKPGLPLESQINNILATICKAIAETRAWREYYAAAMEEMRVREAAAAAEKKAIESAAMAREQFKNHTIAEAAAWQQATSIKAYAKHIAEIVASSDKAPSAELSPWISSAANLAIEIDPTNKRITSR